MMLVPTETSDPRLRLVGESLKHDRAKFAADVRTGLSNNAGVRLARWTD